MQSQGKLNGGKGHDYILDRWRGDSLSSKFHDRSTNFYDVARHFSTALQHNSDANGHGAANVTENNIQCVKP
jgi:hypothetical protein